MKTANDNPRILVLDIETKLMEAYTFAIRDVHLTHKQIKSHGGISCIGLKWVGEKKATVLTEWEHGQRGMLQGTLDALIEADAVVTFNGASFDLPRIAGQLLLHGLGMIPPVTHIDIFKPLRRMGFPSTKLDYVAPILGLGGKVKHDGLDLWIAVHKGCPKARAKMVRYCAGDVRLTEDVFERVKPYIPNFPHLGRTRALECTKCGGDRFQRRGTTRTASFITERLQCQGCGAWSKGRRAAA